MATDIERQANTDAIIIKLDELKALADAAIALDMVPQMPVGDCTLRLDEIVSADFRNYLKLTFEPTP